MRNKNRRKPSPHVKSFTNQQSCTSILIKEDTHIPIVREDFEARKPKMNPVLKMLLISCVAAALAVADDSPKCSCGVFKNPTPDTTSEAPVLMKSPNFPIQCEVDGKEACAKMCIALAEAAKESGPKVLCERVGTTSEPFSPLIYSKSCGDAEWSNTGLKSSIQVCCADNNVVSCQS